MPNDINLNWITSWPGSCLRPGSFARDCHVGSKSRQHRWMYTRHLPVLNSTWWAHWRITVKRTCCWMIRLNARIVSSSKGTKGLENIALWESICRLSSQYSLTLYKLIRWLEYTFWYSTILRKDQTNRTLAVPFLSYDQNLSCILWQEVEVSECPAKCNSLAPWFHAHLNDFQAHPGINLVYCSSHLMFSLEVTAVTAEVTLVRTTILGELISSLGSTC